MTLTLELPVRASAHRPKSRPLPSLPQGDSSIAALEQKVRALVSSVQATEGQLRRQSGRKSAAIGQSISAISHQARDVEVAVAAMRALTQHRSKAKIVAARTHDKAVVMNEALVLGSLRQLGLTAAAENLNAQLQAEIAEHKRTEEALRHARTQLAHHAARLKQQVVQRTVELTATNRRLRAAVRLMQKGRNEYRALFANSQHMQKKLRQLTRQILTAQEDERKAISRELHDEVVQMLVGINVELSALGPPASIRQHTLKEKIAHTQRLVAKSVQAVHRFARELRPAVLDDLGLIPALHAYSQNLAERKHFKIQMTAFSGVEALDAPERTVLFRVAQEALTNIVRHAHATLVKLNISQIPGAVRMEISDNGQSFHVERALHAKNPKRLGLVGMRERIEMVGGRLTIESRPGEGTTVRTEIPFASEHSKK